MASRGKFPADMLAGKASAMKPQTLSLRSYGRDGLLHRHDHVQMVLPISGVLDIEIEGKGGYLDAARAAIVMPQADHVQFADGENRFLIVDFLDVDLGEQALAQLGGAMFLPILEPARKLIEFVSLSAGQQALGEDAARHAAALLLDAMSRGPGRQLPLSGLLRRLEAGLGESWTVERMAAYAGVSESRLFGLFRSDTGMTPQAWLSQARLRSAGERLRHTDIAIAQLAFETGFSDQTALTRAMRRETGLTPAAYRKLHRP